MRILGISMVLASALGAAEKLEDYTWKKRLLVVTESSVALAEKLTAAGMVERDVEIFFLQGPEKKPGEALARQLRERLKVRDGVAEVLLLGKDGRTTLRWPAADFTTASLFAKIDAMPMRKDEMRGR